MRWLSLLLLLFAAPALAGPIYVAKPGGQEQAREQKPVPYVRPGARPLSNGGIAVPRVYTQYQEARAAAQANPQDVAAQRRAALLARAARAAEEAQGRVDAMTALRAEAEARAAQEQRGGNGPAGSAAAASVPPPARRVYIAPQKTPSTPPALFRRQN